MDLRTKDVLIIGQLKTSRTEALEDYLRPRCRRLAVIGFMSAFASYDESRATLYENGTKQQEWPLRTFTIKNVRWWNRPLMCLTFLGYIGAVLSAVRRFKIIFDMGIGIATFPALLAWALKKQGIARYSVYYCLDYYPPPPRLGFNTFVNIVYKYLDAWLVRHVDVVWEISPRIKEGRKKYMGVRPDSYHPVIVPLGYSRGSERMVPFEQRERWTLGFVGTLSDNQGLQMVIDAMPELVKRFPEIRVRVVGHGPFAQTLRDLIKKRGVEQQFMFHGFVKDDQEVNGILSHCMAGLATWTGDASDNSRYADPGKPKLYALLGLPIIITDAPYVSRLIGKIKAGEVIRYDSGEFVTAVSKILNDRDLFAVYEKGIKKFLPYCLAEGLFQDAFARTGALLKVAADRKAAIKNRNVRFWTINAPGIDNEVTPDGVGTVEFFRTVDEVRYRQEPYLEDFFAKFIRPGAQSLEVGIGLGSDLRTFARRGVRVTGLDYSPDNAWRSSLGLRANKLEGVVVAGDAESLPFPDDSFQMVYSWGCLHHTPNTQKSIDELFRVCAPGGAVMVMLYHKGYQYWFILLEYVLTLKWLRKKFQDYLSWRYDYAPLSQMFSRRELRRLFRHYDNVAIEVVTFGGIQSHPVLKYIWQLFKIFPVLLRSMGSFAVTTAVKPGVASVQQTLPALCCPQCHALMTRLDAGLQCINSDCRATYTMYQDSIPVMHPNADQILKEIIHV